MRMDSQVQGLLEELKNKDLSTYQHSVRVEDLVGRYSKTMNLGAEMSRRLNFCAKFHDIGKLILPARILKKPDTLTDAEWTAMKEHPRFGSELIRRVFGPAFLKESRIVLAHHERADGSGYPNKLHRNEIPLESKIIAVADAVDVMLHGRSYQKSMSIYECKCEVLRFSGTQFDPEVAVSFVEKVL